MNKASRKEFYKKKVKRILEYFLQGLLYLAPLGLTVWISYGVINYIDNIIQPAIESIFKMKIPGLGLVIIFLVITIVGFLGQSFFATQIRLFTQKLILKAPILESLYSSIKDFVSAFVGKERKFTRVVLVKMNLDSPIEKMGFITQEDLSSLKIKDKVAVYFPYSYSFMGELSIVPKELITELDIHSSDAMKFIISGGVTGLGLEKDKKEIK